MATLLDVESERFVGQLKSTKNRDDRFKLVDEHRKIVKGIYAMKRAKRDKTMKYSKETAERVSAKLTKDLYVYDDEIEEEMTRDDIYRTLTRIEDWNDGAVLANAYCQDSGSDISMHVVDTFCCAALYADYIEKHGVEDFNRVFDRPKKRATP